MDRGQRGSDGEEKRAPAEAAGWAVLCPDDTLRALEQVARDVGIEFDTEETEVWLGEVAAALATPEEFVVLAAGIGGHELALPDFPVDALTRFRRLGRIAGMPAVAGVRAALALSGSAAQGRIQPYPADVDFFERVLIAAPTREAALGRLAVAVRANALGVGLQAGLRLQEVYFGCGAAGCLIWDAAEIEAGRKAVGADWIGWEEAARQPGFVKLDWWLSDRDLGGPGKVSKVVDAIWEQPDGSVASLGGVLDAEFQQVYLDPAGAGVACGLEAVTTGADQRARYVAAIEGEVRRYATATPPAFEKAAKRLYNLCRFTGRYAEAAYLRELFDEPPARLHQARTELGLLASSGEPDPDMEGAGAGVRRLLDELEELLDGDAACSRAAAHCRSLPEDAGIEAVRAAMVALDAALAASASRWFEARLRACPAVAELLDEIVVAAGRERAGS